jgi:lipopolysaccharide export system protein LptA
MRRLRWLLPPAIIAILIWVGLTYSQRKAALDSQAPAAPPPLEKGLEGRADDWLYTQNSGDLPRVKIRARSFRQIKEPSLMQLDGVELDLYHANGKQFDLVKTASAQFDMNGKTLFSDGQVDITMGVPADGPPQGRILRIHTSGVRFASDTGRASTDRAATFEFDQGGGSAVGAEYDPQTRELHLASQTKLDWRGKSADSVPMHIESGTAVYSEREGKVTLGPWTKLARGTLQMDGGAALILLEKNQLRQADVQNARGTKDDPGRKVDFAADYMVLDFGESAQIRAIEGEKNTRLVSTSDTSRTTMTAERLHLEFAIADAGPNKESMLTAAVSTGNSIAESAPIQRPGVDRSLDLPDTRTLRSETIQLKMRDGGKEIESVETAGAATLDFTPNRPGQPKRNLHGDRIWIAYGSANRIQSFRSVNVTTRTDRPPATGRPSDGKQAQPPSLTASKDIVAAFDPASSELTRIDQNTDFTYDEGDRHARGERASLDQQTGVMTLVGSARMWDPTGSTTADRIVMNQKSSEYTAEGHVASTHLPDQHGNSSAMLSNQEVLEARAQRMVSTNNNRRIHYEGNAVAWQGANRIQADRLDIDRDKHVLEAHGKVVSQFVDKAKGDQTKGGAESAKSKPPASKAPANPARLTVSAPPIFTVVRAPDLLYNDETRLAYYQGGVALERPDLTVNSKELRAFLNDSSSDSSLDKAFADGAVKIVSNAVNPGAGSSPGTGGRRTRTGTSEHAEYYTADQKVILNTPSESQSRPLMVDSVKGRTTGKQLTWFSNNDRLVVDGVESQPAETTLRKK